MDTFSSSVEFHYIAITAL